MTEEFGSQDKADILSLPRKEQEAYIYENLDWESAKEDVLNYPFRREYYPGSDHHLLNLALEMRKFNPKRFEEDQEFTPFTHRKMSERMILDVNHIIMGTNKFTFHTENFLQLAALVKEWAPERFESEVKIGEIHWDAIVELIEEYRGNSRGFIHYYQMAYIMDAQEIKRRLPIDEEYWGKIREDAQKDLLDDFPHNMWPWVLANRIKPEGADFPDITVSQEQLKKMIQYLGFWVSKEKCGEDEFKYANALKNREIKVKN